MTPEELGAAGLRYDVAGAVAVVCTLTDPVDADVLDAAGRQLRIVANVAVGYDNIDVPALHERGVVVTNTLPIPSEKRFDTLEVLSIAPIIAEAIDAVFEDTSVSEIFRGDNV